MYPLCYVIILNWNGKNHLDDCISSVINTKYPRHKILFVDNGSTDGSVNYIRSNYPSIDILENHVNLGFAEGNNRGIQYSLVNKADYIALLNNDTRVEEDWLDVLIDAAEQSQSIALCESQQYTWDGSQKIILTLRPDWLEGEISFESKNSNQDIRATPYAAGCCMLIRSDILQKIGLFDPHYFMYVEDVDLSIRAWIAGYQVLSVPNSVVYHKIGALNPSIKQSKLGYRNQLLTMFKNYELVTLKKFIRPIAKRWVFTRNKYALLSIYSFLNFFPYLLSERRRIQLSRIRSDQEIFNLVGIDW